MKDNIRKDPPLFPWGVLPSFRHESKSIPSEHRTTLFVMAVRYAQDMNLLSRHGQKRTRWNDDEQHDWVIFGHFFQHKKFRFLFLSTQTKEETRRPISFSLSSTPSQSKISCLSSFSWQSLKWRHCLVWSHLDNGGVAPFVGASNKLEFHYYKISTFWGGFATVCH